MAGALIPVWRMQAMEDGAPAPGALLYTWLSGTSTPQAVYSNLALSATHTNPVEADADGVFPIIYLAAVNYRMELRNADGDVIYAATDNIQNLAQFITQGVEGPGSSTNNAIARWDGTDGGDIQNSGITIADGAAGTLAGSNSGDVTLAGALTYLTLANQVLTRGAIALTTDVSGQLPVANGGTGSTTGAIPIVQTTTATGTQADFALSAGTIVHLRCTGAAPSFSGFATGTTGRMVFIECLGTTAGVTDQDSGSSAANQVICPTTAGIVVGLGGWIVLIYDPTTAKWRANQLGTGGSGGLLQVPAGQLQFPATQIPSTGVNVLDDYEEGTWTPVLGGSGGTSGQTYGTTAGFYTKIGKRVEVEGIITLTAKGTITTSVQIQNLPFTSDATANYQSAGVVLWENLATNWVSIGLLLVANATAATVVGTTAADDNNIQPLVAADIANATIIRFCLSYRANA